MSIPASCSAGRNLKSLNVTNALIRQLPDQRVFFCNELQREGVMKVILVTWGHELVLANERNYGESEN
jgi:hypothetical protein